MPSGVIFLSLTSISDITRKWFEEKYLDIGKSHSIKECIQHMGDILYVVRLVISDTELNFFPLEVASFLVLRHVVLTTMFVEVHDLFTSSKST